MHYYMSIITGQRVGNLVERLEHEQTCRESRVQSNATVAVISHH